MTEAIIYDQPLNETIRVCLRLEQLFQQVDHQLIDTSMLGTRNMINCIINILHTLDRPDLKTKLAKELHYFLTSLSRYHNLPEIDSATLNKLTQQLETLYQNLIESSGKIGYRLRDIELLNTLRLQLSNLSSGCSFDNPLYHYWLQQPAESRHNIILDWLNDFSQIKTAVTFVLDFVRKNAKTVEKIAIHGFHQELLDPQSNLRMIRIGIAPDMTAYPEISIGRHFLSVRFYSPSIEKRPMQYTENLPFWIAYCHS